MRRKTLLLTLLVGMTAAPALGQLAGPSLSSQRPAIQVAMGGLYQSFTDDGADVSQLSFPLSVSVPFQNGLAFGLSLRPATTTGTGVADVGGLNDAQLGVSYTRRVGAASMSAGLGVNLPSGKRKLTQEEFATYVLLSQTYYSFQAPSLGQGLNVSPSLTFALPVGDDLAFGLGVLYHLRGAYQPLADREGDYDPGDEIMFTTGLDLRVSPQSSASADVSFTMYMPDTQEGAEVFSAGSKATATLQWRSRFNFDELRLVARYRTKGKNEELAGDGSLTTEAIRSTPNQLLFSAAFAKRLTPAFSLTTQASLRSFNATPVFEEQTVVRLGLQPEIRLGSSLALQLRGAYVLGTLSGFEAGAGFRARL